MLLDAESAGLAIVKKLLIALTITNLIS